ncbi:MAG: TlpA family protein disulfide reductase [Sphingobacteriales bacterium]|nr:MAG: TlpA family protein disulfide reductase [Sphingobacteriales bacterium]
MKQVFFIGFFFFTFLQSSNGQSYLERHATCSEILQGSTPEDSLFWAKLDQRNSCLVGADAPSFEATTLSGEKLNADNLKGKVAVINFWFTRCKPCLEEMPLLNNIVSKYEKENIIFLSFANDDAVKLKKFLRFTEFNFKVVPDSNVLSATFKLFAIWPTTIVIDETGKIQMIKVGGFDKNSIQELDNRIASSLQK